MVLVETWAPVKLVGVQPMRRPTFALPGDFTKSLNTLTMITERARPSPGEPSRVDLSRFLVTHGLVKRFDKAPEFFQRCILAFSKEPFAVAEEFADAIALPIG